MALRRLVRLALPAVIAASAVPLLTEGPALAQPAAPRNAQPQKKKPGKKTDMEVDPDAKPAEEKPLPPVEPGQWGSGGTEEEGKFTPAGPKAAAKDSDAEKAKPPEEKPVDLGPEREVGLDMVIGFGSIHDVTHDAGTGKTGVTPLSFIVSFRWRVADIWTLGARFPMTQSSIDGPVASDVFSTVAAGNLELYVRPSFQLTRRLRLPAQISVFLPTGQGDIYGDTAAGNAIPSAQALINQAASASRGWEEMALFAPKRFGIRAGAGITYDTESIHVAAGTRADVMIRTGGEDPPASGGFLLRDPTYAWTTGASFFYGFGVGTGFIEPGLRAWLTVAGLPTYSTTGDDSGAQFVLEPAVNARFPLNEDRSLAIKGGLGVILPVVGPLGGGVGPAEASIKGFRLHAEFQF